MKDIENRKDIELLVASFYEKLMTDELVKHFFMDVVKIDLSEHLPIIANFWESILLGNSVYNDNPMIKHIEMHRKSPMEAKHFEAWLGHWKSTIDAHFSGEIANTAKSRAQQISDLMHFKTSNIS